MLTDPRSSATAAVWSVFISATIIVANTTFIVDTDPAFYTPAGSDPSVFMTIVDIATTAIFTLEILLTIWSTPRFRNLLDIMFLIDVVVVVPAHIELASGGRGGGASLSVLRVFRLLRVLRLFRVSRSSTTLLVTAVKRSMNVLVMLVLLLFMVVIVLASMMHALERGDWDPVRREWRRQVAWECLYDTELGADGARTVLPSGVVARVADFAPTCTLRDAAGADGREVWACLVMVETGRDCVAAQWGSEPVQQRPQSGLVGARHHLHRRCALSRSSSDPLLRSLCGCRIRSTVELPSSSALVHTLLPEQDGILYM